MPIEPARLSTVPTLPEAIGSSAKGSEIQLPIGQAAFPPVASSLYSSYNLPPAPESHLGHISVCHLPSHFSALVLPLDKLIQIHYSNHIRWTLKTLQTFPSNFLA